MGVMMTTTIERYYQDPAFKDQGTFDCPKCPSDQIKNRIRFDRGQEDEHVIHKTSFEKFEEDPDNPRVANVYSYPPTNKLSQFIMPEFSAEDEENPRYCESFWLLQGYYARKTVLVNKSDGMSISMALAEVNKHMNKESSNTKKQLIADEQFPVYLTPPHASHGKCSRKRGSQYHHPAELCPQKGLREEYFQTVRVRGTQSQVARDWENSLIKSSTPGPSLRNRQPGICVLDPRTVQDHQEHFEDPRCLQRISQAVKQLVDLGELSIEFNLHGIRQLDFSALTQLLEQGFAPTNLRDVRLINRGGSIRPQVSDHLHEPFDPRTARDHRENFEDARCIRRIAQALRELVELGGISIELNSVGSHEVKLAHLTRFLKQYLVETNFRGVRLIDESGGVFELNELLLALTKMCGPS
ncbi:hypothetical protein FOVG_09726 [Fusarium oxysporum f. sp. pisi HDV247]|uniref:Uncharacterized protein n=1 Tax=Fusarium oxysporum f. sp. pisi HDV247 TaxID=1080344 RepID=W9PN70_FUSOX|nr:hypothetical protein FOVG_09726 [Fusarium oxysporum f. sp. pisi HDV247]